MRKLMWFAIGFTAACIAGVYFLSGNWYLLLGLFSVAATMAVYVQKTPTGKRVFVGLLGCTAALLWLWLFDMFYLAEARSYDGKTVNATIELTDYSWGNGFGSAAEGRLDLEGKTYPVQLYLNERETLQPGTTVRGQFALRYTGSGGKQEVTYHQGKGIFLLAYPEGTPQWSAPEKVPTKYTPAVLRKAILLLVDTLFPADTVGFARALLLGDSSKISYTEGKAFQKSGISHVIAVSGMHVSILFSLVYILCGKRRVATAVIGIPVLCLFAAIAGFSPSITRACIMQVLIILALLLNKEYDPPTALAFAVLVMLLCNPLSITSASMQLSVGCMVGIFLFSGEITRYLLSEGRLGPAKGKTLISKLKRWFAGSVSMTLSAMSTTVPLCAVYFGSVSIVGVATNLLTLWVVSLAFYGTMLACLMALIWMPLGTVIAWIVSWLMRYVLETARILSFVPWGVAYMNNVYMIAWLVFAYVLFSVFLAGKRKHPAVFAVCLLVGLCVATAISWIEPRLDPFRVTVLDVGQGQCILLQTDGKNYMVDCGGENEETVADEASKLLLGQGITRLDGLILTHYDTDHACSAELLLSQIPADTLYLPDTDEDNQIRIQLSETYSDRIEWLESQEILALDTFPATIYAAEAGVSDNESSLCILFQPENYDILITGDRSEKGEQALLDQALLPKLELLVVGHHGSKSSSGEALLAATRPAAAVISVGADNSYGHPARSVLERLKNVGCQVWRTDITGTIVFRG